jgi:hypothetical protein
MFLITTMTKTLIFAGYSAITIAGTRMSTGFSSQSNRLITTLMSNALRNSAVLSVSY